MSQSTLLLEVATPQGMALQQAVLSLRAPGSQGQFGVLQGHIPLLSALRNGVLIYETETGLQAAAIGPGVAEVEASRVRIITERFVEAKKVALDEARLKVKEAEEALAKSDAKGDANEYEERCRALEWAMALRDLSEWASKNAG